MRNTTTRRRIGWIAASLLAAAGCSQSRPGMTGGDWLVWLDGKDVSGWIPTAAPEENAWTLASAVALDPADPTHFAITPGTGILVDGPVGKTCNLVSSLQHGDCEAHIEFVVPRGSNSGVYFMGKYEIQILDSYGKEHVEFSDCGGIYARWIDEKNVDGHAPRVNASRAPGEWQEYDVVFRAPRFDAQGNKIENARFVRVVHNGKVVHENVELKGPTRAALPGPEQKTGPLMLQGDHGPVAYRNIRVRSLTDAGGK